MANSSVLPMLLFTFGLVFIFASIVEYFFPSKSRDQKGYRSKRSLFTQESWDFAQKYYAKMMFRCSLLFIVLSFLSAFLPISDTVGAIFFGVILLAACFFIYFLTENALKEKF